MSCCPPRNTIEEVKEYYGKTLQSKDDLVTSACTTAAQKMPRHVIDVFRLIHDEVTMKYYGCGLVVPDCLTSMKVLDLGSGSGRDCYALSSLVGAEGHVTGIDMTKEQLEVANKYVDYHTKAFGYDKPNVTFVEGYLEDLKAAGIKDESMDIIVSNCVINLVEDKEKVLREAWRVLKVGGELYFSDVYCDRQLSEEVRKHKVLWGECVSGALYWKKLFDLASSIGFQIPRTVVASEMKISKPEHQQVLGDAKFSSVVYRLFKVNTDDSTKYEVMYNGDIIGCPEQLKFDHNLTFKKDEPVTLDSSTSAIIRGSRFNDHFTIRKAPCCAKPNEVQLENPFEIICKAESSEGGDSAVSQSCCSGSKCC